MFDLDKPLSSVFLQTGCHLKPSASQAENDIIYVQPHTLHFVEDCRDSIEKENNEIMAMFIQAFLFATSLPRLHLEQSDRFPFLFFPAYSQLVKRL